MTGHILQAKKKITGTLTKNDSLSSALAATTSDGNVCIPFTTFQYIKHHSKGCILKHLKLVEKMSSLSDIISFTQSILGKASHYHNQLDHCWNAIHLLTDNFDVIFLYIDFSGNLIIPVKFEPQSMHWHLDTVTVHSGRVKLHREKSYHPYASDNKQHEQAFVKLVLEKMLESVVSLKCV